MFRSRPFIGLKLREDFGLCEINFKRTNLREINNISIISIVHIERTIGRFLIKLLRSLFPFDNNTFIF